MKISEVIKLAARELRKNMTESEVILWWFIRDEKLWVKFLRQKAVFVYTENSWLDRYIIPDFYCFEKKIILEIDWSIHNKEDIYQLDLYKEKLLKNMWYKVIRIKNEQIKTNIYDVIQNIKNNT